MIFAVFDVLLAVNMCINYSFFTFLVLSDAEQLVARFNKSIEGNGKSLGHLATNNR